MMDSELIRYTMRNVGLAKDGFAPTAVVTLESQSRVSPSRERSTRPSTRCWSREWAPQT